jgi:two-component system NtrC family response regulator
LRVARERADRAAIVSALAANNGNMSAAARDLDISRPMLYDLMNSYGMTKG